MESHLEHTMKMADIANKVGLSQRQLARLFKTHTGISPIQYYVEVRLDRAHGMVTQTQLPILSIAVACGFNSQEHFSKAYHRRFACSPSQDRRQGRTPISLSVVPCAPCREINKHC
jgi:AraC family carnitine catabolism transcriptional activator